MHNQFQVAFSTASSGSNQIVGSPRSRSEQRRRKQLEWRQQRLLGKLGDQGIGNIRNNKFGFNSVLLTVSTSRKELIEEGATFMPVSFQDAAIRVIALDSAHGDILFSMEPTIADSSLEIQWIRLLPSRMANLLIVSARDGSLFVWNINLASKAYRVVSPSRVYHGVFAMSVHTVPSSVPLFLLVSLPTFLSHHFMPLMFSIIEGWIERYCFCVACDSRMQYRLHGWSRRPLLPLA